MKRIAVAGGLAIGVALALMALSGCMGIFGSPPEVSIEANPTAGLAPLTVSFRGVVVSADAGISSWQWSFGDGATGSGQEVAHRYENPGNFTVTMVATDACNRTSDQATITINVGRPVPVIRSIVVDPSPVCANSPARLSAVVDHVRQISSYVWQSSDGHTSTSASTSFTFGRPGTKTITLTVKDDWGATATKTVTLTVKDCCPPPCNPCPPCTDCKISLVKNRPVYQAGETATIQAVFSSTDCWERCSVSSAADVDPKGIVICPDDCSGDVRLASIRWSVWHEGAALSDAYYAPGSDQRFCSVYLDWAGQYRVRAEVLDRCGNILCWAEIRFCVNEPQCLSCCE